MLSARTPDTKPEKNPSQSTMYSRPIPIACVETRPSHTNADAYSTTPTKAETVTATVAVVSARNATWLVRNALTSVNGAAIVMVARSFGTAIFHRGIGDSVRF